MARRIERVRYLEIPYGVHDYGDPAQTPQPMWSGIDRFDSIDYGLELDLDNGALWSVEWQQAGLNESLRPADGPIARGHGFTESWETAVWDVTDRWEARGPRVISSVTTIWVRAGRFADMSLVTIILSAEDGRVAVITLGEERDGAFVAIPDNVAVFFSVGAAATAGVLLADQIDEDG